MKEDFIKIMKEIPEDRTKIDWKILYPNVNI